MWTQPSWSVRLTLSGPSPGVASTWLRLSNWILSVVSECHTDSCLDPRCNNLSLLFCLSLPLSLSLSIYPTPPFIFLSPLSVRLRNYYRMYLASCHLVPALNEPQTTTEKIKETERSVCHKLTVILWCLIMQPRIQGWQISQTLRVLL